MKRRAEKTLLPLLTKEYMKIIKPMYTMGKGGDFRNSNSINLPSVNVKEKPQTEKAEKASNYACIPFCLAVYYPLRGADPPRF